MQVQVSPLIQTPQTTLEGGCLCWCEGGSGGDEHYSSGEFILRNSPPPEMRWDEMVTEISQTLSAGSVVCLPRIVDRLESANQAIRNCRNISEVTYRTKVVSMITNARAARHYSIIIKYERLLIWRTIFHDLFYLTRRRWWSPRKIHRKHNHLWSRHFYKK